MTNPQGIQPIPHIYGLSYKGELVYIGIHNGRDKYYFSSGTIPNKIGRDNMIKGVVQYSDLKSLPLLEMEYIERYKPKFNLTSGGDRFSGYSTKHSEATIEKRKKSLASNTSYLKKLSDRIKLRNSINNPCIKHNIICVNDGLIYGSIREAGRYYNIDNSYLSKHLRGIYKEVKGLIFKRI